MNIIGKMLDELYRIFNIVNMEKFDNCLPMPMITIQKGKGNNFVLKKVKDRERKGTAQDKI